MKEVVFQIVVVMKKEVDVKDVYDVLFKFEDVLEKDERVEMYDSVILKEVEDK